jgi:hypothetical protein
LRLAEGLLSATDSHSEDCGDYLSQVNKRLEWIDELFFDQKHKTSKRLIRLYSRKRLKRDNDQKDSVGKTTPSKDIELLSEVSSITSSELTVSKPAKVKISNRKPWSTMREPEDGGGADVELKDMN